MVHKQYEEYFSKSNMSSARSQTLSQRRKFLLKIDMPEGSSDYGEYHPCQHPTTDEIDSLPSKRRRVEDEEAKEESETMDERKDEEIDEDYDFWCPYIREKYMRYTPKYVSTMTSIDELKCVQDWYRPCSQPHSRHEYIYFDLVAVAADKRLRELM